MCPVREEVISCLMHIIKRDPEPARYLREKGDRDSFKKIRARMNNRRMKPMVALEKIVFFGCHDLLQMLE